MKRITKVKEAAYFAISKHGNQTYDGYPYYYHLEQVVDVLKEFEFTEDKYIISGYLHDVLEDGDASYNDIKDLFGVDVAEIVYSVSDELGRNRKERKAKTYPKIRANKDAIIVKLADLIANLRNSLLKKPHMAEMYANEFEGFKNELYDQSHYEASRMWVELEKILIETPIS